ncbi:unnamed protein product [Moneuplotes crassus]|uniref:Uncharacterized protein n=1 Tax=Euplotes crassus TaxID=5936 RepID=A0AAD1XWS4_EUPCR|nr:unnamed protein product [Moneuplotes crassus]
MVTKIIFLLFVCGALGAVVNRTYTDETAIVADFGETDYEVLLNTDGYGPRGGGCKRNALACVKSDESYQIRDGDKAFSFGVFTGGWACTDYFTSFENSTVSVSEAGDVVTWNSDGTSFEESRSQDVGDDENLKYYYTTKYLFNEESYAYTNFPSSSEVGYYKCFQLDHGFGMGSPLDLAKYESFKVKVTPSSGFVKNLLR